MAICTSSAAVSTRNKFSSGFKFLGILLLVLLVSGKSWGQSTYTLCTQVSDLVAGSKYIIVSSQNTGSAKAMGYQNTNNRPQATTSVTIASSAISTTVATAAADATKPYEITLGGTTGAWTLQDPLYSNYYLKASSSASNYLVTTTSAAIWTITFSSNTAVMTCTTGSFSNNILRYNSSSSLFSCYGSGQSAVYLYKYSLPSPTLTADATNNDVDNNIDITFTEDAAWRTAITGITVGGTTLDPSAYNKTVAGKITFTPSASALLQSSGSKSIVVIATGYSNATVSQSIGAGAPKSANSTVSISAALALNTTRTITCTAKDQYNNLVSGYKFKYDATVTNNDVTTTESYTIDGTARTSTVSNIDVVSATNASGIATFTVALPTLIDGNDGISVQAQLSDGSTNIGSAFSFYQLLSQTISFGALTAVTYGDGIFTISAIGGASGNPVVFTSSNSAVATCTGTNGTTITVIAPGNCTINANQAGNASYNAAIQVGQSLVVNTKTLTIPDAAAQNKIYSGTNAAVITGTLTGKVGSDVVTLNGTGTFASVNVADGITVTSTCTLGGTDAAKYTLTQPINLTADINKADQSITGVTGAATKYVGDADYTFTANTTTSATNALSYVSSTTAVATINATTGLVHIVAGGSTTITVSQAGNANYNAAPDVIQTLTVKATPIAAWNFNGIANTNTSGNGATFAATTFNSNLVTSGNASDISRGSTSSWSTGGNSFRTTGFQNNGISTSNTDYFQAKIQAATGKNVSLSTIDANLAGTGTYCVSPGVTSQFAYSLDGTNFTLIGSAQTIIGTPQSIATIDLTSISSLQNVSNGTTIYLRYYASGQTTTGGWGFYSAALGTNGLAIGGSISIPISTSTNASTIADCTTCDVSVASTGTLTVDATKAYNSITVESGGKLNTTQPLTVGNLVLKAYKDATTFSSKIDASITASSVKLYKTIDDSKWYFMAFPCDVTVAGITKSNGDAMTGLGTDWFIKYYDGAKRANDGSSNGSNWVSVTGGTLTANRGYIFGLKTGKPETEILIPLNTSILAAEADKGIAVAANTGTSADNTNYGWNLIGQPYLSIYSAQTGSNAPYMIMPNPDGRTYTTTAQSAGTLPVINPFAAYFVQASGDGTISFGIAGRQNLPASVANNVSENLKLKVTTPTGSDDTYLIMDNDQTTGYEIGKDMVKWLGTGTDLPQLYTLLGGVNYAFNALPVSSVVNLPVGFYTKTAGSSTLSVNALQAPGLSKLLLTDIKEGVTTDLLVSDYNFTATEGTDNGRFIISAQRVTTDNNLVSSGEGVPKVLTLHGKLVLNDLAARTTIRVYDAIGRMIINKMAMNSSIEIPLKVAGLYTVRIDSGTKNWTMKIVNNN